MIAGMAFKIDFSQEKDQLLKTTRGIGFGDIIRAIDEGRLLANKSHPSQRYSHQRLLAVHIGSYVYAVPYVLKGKGIFLKTIYPSRVLKKKYLKEKSL